jgi:hypothetical protein
VVRALDLPKHQSTVSSIQLLSPLMRPFYYLNYTTKVHSSSFPANERFRFYIADMVCHSVCFTVNLWQVISAR